jgi:hypothetical protein
MERGELLGRIGLHLDVDEGTFLRVTVEFRQMARPSMRMVRIAVGFHWDPTALLELPESVGIVMLRPLRSSLRFSSISSFA